MLGSFLRFFLIFCVFLQPSFAFADIDLQDNAFEATFFVSSTRGTAPSSTPCSYDHPCPTFDSVVNHMYNNRSVLVILLSGRNDMTSLSTWSLPDRVEYLRLMGSRDCFPNPPNSAGCTAPLPTVGSIKVGKPPRPVRFELQNVMIQPTTSTTNLCNNRASLAILETLSDDLSFTWFKMQNVSVDASDSGNSSLCIRVRVTEEATITDILVNRTSNSMDYTENLSLFLDFYRNRSAPANFTIARIESLPSETLLDLHIQPLGMSRINLTNSIVGRLDVADTDANIVQLFLSQVSIHGPKCILRADIFDISDSTFNNSLVVLSQLDLYEHAASNLSLIRNVFWNTTFAPSVESVVARHNIFHSGYSINAGVTASCLMSGAGDEVIDARHNFWNDRSGPATCCNPGGMGSFTWRNTDFSSWCLSSECDEYANSTYENFDVKSTCFRESFCTAQTSHSMTASLVFQGVILASGISALVLIYLKSNQNIPEVKFRRLASTACVVMIASIITWIADAAVLITAISPTSSIATSYSGSLRRISLTMLIGMLFLLCIFAIATIVTLRRYADPKRRYPGLRLIMITFLLSSLSLVFFALIVQNTIPIFAWTAIVPGTDPLRVLVLRDIGDNFLPSTRMWIPWACATSVGQLLGFMITYFLWRVIKERDYADIDDAYHEVSIRSHLLGQAKASLLRDTESAQLSRRVAFLWILPGLLGAATITSFVSGNGVVLKENSRMHTTDLILIGNGLFVCYSGFAFFFWRHYYVILLWIQVVNSIWISMTTGGIVMNWVVLQRSPAAMDEAPNNLAVALGVCYSLSFSAGSLLTMLFIRRLSKRLASEMGVSVQRKMEDIYDRE